MTKNQRNLLQFLGEYRMKHGNSPTLREIVSEIGISDNKSALGIIKNLIDQGYLTKNAKKSRSIFLTDAALKQLGLNKFTINYKKTLNPSDYLRLPKTFDVKSVSSVSMPVGNNTHYSGGDINTSGSSLSDIQSAVEIAVSFALSNFANGTFTNQKEKKRIADTFVNVCSNILEQTNFPEKLSWSLTLIILSTYCISILGKNVTAVTVSIVYFFVIFIIFKSK